MFTVKDIKAKMDVSGFHFLIGSKKTVPDAQNISIITICIRHFVVMVYLVQVRGDQQEAQYFTHFPWQAEMSMCNNVGKGLHSLS